MDLGLKGGQLKGHFSRPRKDLIHSLLKKKKKEKRQYMLLIYTYIGNLNIETVGRINRAFSECR